MTAYASLASWRGHRRASDHVPPGDRRGTRGGAGEGTGRRGTGGDAIDAARPHARPAERRQSTSGTPISGCRPGESVVVTGRSGSGKSTLFRAIAGIWPFGSGQVSGRPERCLFLPQRPYIPLGTLRHVIAYPAPTSAFEKHADGAGSRGCRPARLVPHLDDDENWAQRLPAASSSVSPSPAHFSPSPIGCFSTKRLRAWTRSRRHISIARSSKNCRTRRSSPSLTARPSRNSTITGSSSAARRASPASS